MGKITYVSRIISSFVESRLPISSKVTVANNWGDLVKHRVRGDVPITTIKTGDNMKTSQENLEPPIAGNLSQFLVVCVGFLTFVGWEFFLQGRNRDVRCLKDDSMESNEDIKRSSHNSNSRNSESHFSSNGKEPTVPKWISQQLRVTAAYHEAGHVVCAWYLPHIKEVCEVSIVPEGRRGGYTRFQKDPKLTTEEELFDQMCVDLAGMAAEELFLGGVTPLSNSDDLASVTHSAAIALTRIYVQLGLHSRNYAAEEKKNVENALTLTLICKAYGRTLALLQEHQEDVRKIAHRLLEKDTLSTAEMTEILGKRPTNWRPRFL